jgi:hypothetical protein
MRPLIVAWDSRSWYVCCRECQRFLNPWPIVRYRTAAVAADVGRVHYRIFHTEPTASLIERMGR